MIKVINDLCIQFLFSEKMLSVELFFFKGCSEKIKAFDIIATSVIQPRCLCCDWTGWALRGLAINPR